MVELEGRRCETGEVIPLLEHPTRLYQRPLPRTESFKMAKKSGSGGFGKIFLGFLLGIAVVAIGLFAYLKFGPLPVAVADAPLPFEKQIVKLPLNARIERETKTAPFGISEDVFESGAHVYRAQCASCHGTPGHDVALCEVHVPVRSAAVEEAWQQRRRRG